MTNSLLSHILAIVYCLSGGLAQYATEWRDYSDSFDPDWLLYGDRVELADSDIQSNFNCSCQNRAEAQMADLFNGTSAISLPMLIPAKSLDQYCAVRQTEDRCKRDQCNIRPRWSMSSFLCDKLARQEFRSISGCWQKSTNLINRICHPDCWQRLARLYGKPLDVDFAGSADDLSKECYYQDCYLSCQKVVLKGKCGVEMASRADNFMRTYVSNRTQAESAMAREIPLPPDCDILAHHAPEVCVPVSDSRIDRFGGFSLDRQLREGTSNQHSSSNLVAATNNDNKDVNTAQCVTSMRTISLLAFCVVLCSLRIWG